MGLGRLVSAPGVGNLLHFVLASLLTSAGLFACVWYAAKRVRELRGLLPRCVPVPGRVVSAERIGHEHGLTGSLRMLIEYGEPDARRRAHVDVAPPLFDLVGPTPQLLVDPDNPAHVFVRDLVL